jgi:PAS domain S-box-containing protein
MQDITARKTAEDILRSNEEKYRSMITNMNLGLLEVDDNEIITFANKSFSDMSGFSNEELLGNTPRSLLFRDSSKEFMDKKHELRKKGISDVYEIEIRDKSGEKKWWLISGAPRYDDKGQLVGSIGIHLDITEQKNLEHELIKSRETAENLSRAKENFLANMSHEIRTPMNAIMGMSSQLTKTALNPQQRFYLDTIHSAADNLLVIINDILDLSKIEAGKLTLENIGFHLEPILNRSINVLEHKAEEKGLVLSRVYMDSRVSPILLGDPYRLNQVMLNLLSNSIKFTDKGSISVAVELISDQPLTQTIRFAIKDTGIGMDDEYIGHLFEKFSQEYESVTRKYGGTGLGMSICKELIELMEGKISATSKKGEGTTIVFEIPFRKGTEADLPEEPVAVQENAIKDRSILVVDDNDMNRLVASTVLKYYGAFVLEAASGEESLTCLADKNIDLILMDIQMPGLNGIETTKRIRANGRNIPIIAMTANALKGESEKCLAAGMNDYISKPFKEEELINIISRWVNENDKSIQPKKQDEDMPAAQLYDLSSLQSISKGNDEFIKKMIRMFCEQTPRLVTDMVDSYQKGDISNMASIAHKIKPSIDNLNISELKQTIRDIESAAKKNFNPNKLNEDLDNTLKIITSVVNDLNSKFS